MFKSFNRYAPFQPFERLEPIERSERSQFVAPNFVAQSNDAKTKELILG